MGRLACDTVQESQTRPKDRSVTDVVDRRGGIELEDLIVRLQTISTATHRTGEVHIGCSNEGGAQ